MGNTWIEDVYQVSGNANSTLNSFELLFEMLRANFAGDNAAAPAIEGQFWYDYTSGTNGKPVIKIHDGVGYTTALLTGDADHKLLCYRPDAMDGWVVTTLGTDFLVAVKSDAGSYTTAGTTTGNWVISGLSHTHTGPSHYHTISNHYHQWYEQTTSTQHDKVWNSASSQVSLATVTKTSGHHISVGSGVPLGTPAAPSVDLYTNQAGAGNTGSDGTGNTSSGGASDGAWRPSAAVFTIQNIDI